MPISVTHDSTMSTAAASRFWRKRLRPGKVSAKTSSITVSSGRLIGSSTYELAKRNTMTVIAGSMNAATSDVTDWGAL